MNNVYNNEEFFKEYSQMYRSQKGLEGAGEWHQLQPLFPDLSGKSVLDLGCGYGWHCKYAIERGASSALGLDLSEKMIEAAKAKNADPKISYRVCGIDVFEYPENSYDCVISNLVLHYIKDIKAIYKNVYTTLKKDGVFLLNIEHPIFTSGVNQDWAYNADGTPSHWPVDNYFYPGARETLFLGKNVTKQHHTFTQIVNGLIEVGFSINNIEEAMPSEDMLKMDGMLNEMRRPMMLLIKATK